MLKLLSSWKNSPFFRGVLEDWIDINPRTDIINYNMNESVSFIPMEAVDIDGSIELQIKKLSEVYKGYTRFKENDVICAKITPCMQNGKAAVIKGLISNIGFGSTEFHVLRVKNDKEVLPSFLYYSLTSPSYLESAEAIFTGTAGQQRLPESFLRQLPLPIPSFPIQHEMVNEISLALDIRRRKLNEADSLISGLNSFFLDSLGLLKYREEIKKSYAVNLKILKNSRLDVLYHQPYFRNLFDTMYKAKIEIKRLGDIIYPLAGGATPKRANREQYSNAGIKFLRIMNISPFEIKLDDIKYITPEVHNGLLGRSQLQENDILMTITGRVGTSAVVSADVLPANINQHIVRIRLLDKTISPEYLVVYLNSSIGLTFSNREVSGGTRIALDYDAIRNLILPVPKQRIRQEIINEFNKRLSAARQLRNEATQEWEAAKAIFEDKLKG